jgi:hypothetical protein
MIDTVMRYKSPPGINGTSNGTSMTSTGVRRMRACSSAISAATVTARNSPIIAFSRILPIRKINHASAPPSPIVISFVPRS